LSFLWAERGKARVDSPCSAGRAAGGEASSLPEPTRHLPRNCARHVSTPGQLPLFAYKTMHQLRLTMSGGKGESAGRLTLLRRSCSRWRGLVASGTTGREWSSLVLRAVLPKLGYRNSLLVYAGISAVIYVIAFFLLETRKPPAHRRRIECDRCRGKKVGRGKKAPNADRNAHHE
jgi:hypothetical protein